MKINYTSLLAFSALLAFGCEKNNSLDAINLVKQISTSCLSDEAAIGITTLSYTASGQKSQASYTDVGRAAESTNSSVTNYVYAQDLLMATTQTTYYGGNITSTVETQNAYDSRGLKTSQVQTLNSYQNGAINSTQVYYYRFTFSSNIKPDTMITTWSLNHAPAVPYTTEIYTYQDTLMSSRTILDQGGNFWRSKLYTYNSFGLIENEKTAYTGGTTSEINYTYSSARLVKIVGDGGSGFVSDYIYDGSKLKNIKYQYSGIDPGFSTCSSSYNYTYTY